MALVLLWAGPLVGRLFPYAEPTQMDISTSRGWTQTIRTGGRLKDIHKYKLRGQGVRRCYSYSPLTYRACNVKCLSLFVTHSEVFHCSVTFLKINTTKHDVKKTSDKFPKIGAWITSLFHTSNLNRHVIKHLNPINGLKRYIFFKQEDVAIQNKGNICAEKTSSD